MSEITRQKIFEKLQQLDGYLSNLKKLKKEIKSPEEFLEDFHLYGLAERYLQFTNTGKSTAGEYINICWKN